MIFFFITQNPQIAEYVVSAGVDRIFVDLEYLGKERRQRGRDTVISRHLVSDVATVRPYVPKGRLLVRVNPIHPGSSDEIDAAIKSGADIVMLPMFTGGDQVRTFVDYVDGRARTCLLLETAQAAASIRTWIQEPGIDEVHIGLNDLHLDLGLHFMFEPVVNGLVDDLAAVLRGARIPFGIGGVARVGEGLLPAEIVLAEHVRLGSGAAILSRTFHRSLDSVESIRTQMDFPAELLKLRSAYSLHQRSQVEDLDRHHANARALTEGIVASMVGKPRRQG